MAEYPGFDDNVISQSLAAAKRHSDELTAANAAGSPTLADGALKLGAQCISVTVNNNQVCLNLPLGIGGICLPVPGWVPNGASVQACLDICTKWSIPCGVEVTVSFNGQTVVSKGFGCSC